MFEVAFVTPTSQRTIMVAWLECQTPRGNLVIQKGHAPLVTALKPYTEVRFAHENGDVEAVELSGGVVEVLRNSATIIVDK